VANSQALHLPILSDGELICLLQKSLCNYSLRCMAQMFLSFLNISLKWNRKCVFVITQSFNEHKNFV